MLPADMARPNDNRPGPPRPIAGSREVQRPIRLEHTCGRAAIEQAEDVTKHAQAPQAALEDASAGRGDLASERRAGPPLRPLAFVAAASWADATSTVPRPLKWLDSVRWRHNEATTALSPKT